MATQLEELQKMMKGMRTPGMSRTASTASGSASGATRNGTAASLEFTGDLAGVRRPGMTAGRSSVPTTNPAERVARANRILETPAQASRTSTEASLNPQVGESLRRALIEQQRVSGPTYGSMGAFERRDRRESQQTAQTAVDSGLAALQGIREGALTERGQNLDATTVLENRQMQEAGAFDRALLGLDQTMLEGQFGMADREAATEAARNPLEEFALMNMRGLLAGDDATASDVRNVTNAALGLSAIAGPGGGPSLSFDMTGLSGEFTPEQLQDPAALAIIARSLPDDQGQQLLESRGYTADPDSAFGITPIAEINQRAEARRAARVAAEAEEERQRQRAVAAYLRDNPLNPDARVNMINNQTRN